MNEGVKSALKSRAIWGGAIALLAGAVRLAGYDVDPASQMDLVDNTEKLVGLALDLASVVGGILAIVGRIFASKRIGKTGAPVLAIALTFAACAHLSACAGMTKQDCLTRVAASEVAITQGYKTAADLVSQGVISKDVGRRALKALDAANAATDSAAPICKLDEPKALDYLQQAAKAMLEFSTLTGASQ